MALINTTVNVSAGLSFQRRCPYSARRFLVVSGGSIANNGRHRWWLYDSHRKRRRCDWYNAANGAISAASLMAQRSAL